MYWLFIKYSEEMKLLAQSIAVYPEEIGKEFIGTRCWCLPLTAPERMIHSQLLANQIIGGGA